MIPPPDVVSVPVGVGVVPSVLGDPDNSLSGVDGESCVGGEAEMTG
jgi:hypothetical protein